MMKFVDKSGSNAANPALRANPPKSRNKSRKLPHCVKIGFPLKYTSSSNTIGYPSVPP
jgi:hypothetical protein